MIEEYIQYNAEKNLVYYFYPDGSCISLNSSDWLYVWHNGKWVWTKLCLDLDKGWYLNQLPELPLQNGKVIKATTDNLFEE